MNSNGSILGVQGGSFSQCTDPMCSLKRRDGSIEELKWRILKISRLDRRRGRGEGE